jgi:hypothetical protein
MEYIPPDVVRRRPRNALLRRASALVLVLTGSCVIGVGLAPDAAASRLPHQVFFKGHRPHSEFSLTKGRACLPCNSESSAPKAEMSGALVFHLSVQRFRGGAPEEEGEESSTPTSRNTSSMDDGAESWTSGSSESEDLTCADSERIVGQSASTVNDEVSPDVPNAPVESREMLVGPSEGGVELISDAATNDPALERARRASVIQELLSMGADRRRAEVAADNGETAEAALNWLLEHVDDHHLFEASPQQQPRGAIGARKRATQNFVGSLLKNFVGSLFLHKRKRQGGSESARGLASTPRKLSRGPQSAAIGGVSRMTPRPPSPSSLINEEEDQGADAQDSLHAEEEDADDDEGEEEGVGGGRAPSGKNNAFFPNWLVEHAGASYCLFKRMCFICP